ncbi:efflux transporter outer membrane subunit [Acetobacter tropicalis]|jgi:multidrug efflux system outer membrane protein|uniref:RND efflux system, outer membrane lipoprotein CmeC n=1 Tax=Acetobacter tropicalis TaxID=104102 RepID=A0A094YKT7_9PROT|nr:efflux transporter outer membrane subunit [Acetobacter tropicalis]KAA8390770.1 efflux transporter outer membrane subunit [Acetobacter tropicalis]KAA8393165.1 efflux transporter outer membrane subunit [Acetobacter tropicalis]KGB22655.1 RND efflux system, outer membrane lipoprotein CmeC [Acetobacter tropicalis]MBC9007355.1 efflux transporter outer membrane subunit [Acetobacter tropicalis]MDO8171543.1 efflux transporter outer membrane subunit [Acetobacter tropicalis]
MSAFSSSPRPLRFRALSLALATGVLSGCTMIPKYKRPAPPLATTWPAYQNTGNPKLQQAAYDIGWNDFFTDPRLKALIAIAIRENRDLRVAAANIAEAQGQYDVQHAGLFPTISASGGPMYQAPSDAAGLSFAPGLGSESSEKSGMSLARDPFRYYQGGIGFSSYEIDLFGRIRSLTRESAEKALSEQANLRGMLISIVSQVATAYVTWLGDKETLAVADNTLTTQQETLNLTREKYNHGEANLLTVRQAETQVQQSAALRADSRRKVAQDENLITLLIGAPIPANLPPPQPLGQQTILADLPAGVPSDLLTRRPDIVGAEHDLLAAQADIGAARAAFFPRLTLTANDGISSLQFHQLFTSAATTWGLNPQLQIPLWTWGMNSGNLKASKARRDGKIASYEKTVQSAFREVADALAAREAYLDEKKQVDDLVTSSADAFRLAKMRYDAGTDSYLTTLDSQRSYLQAQQIQIMVAVSNYQNLITIYRALGGGWKEHTLPPKSPVPVARQPVSQTG